MASTAPIAIGTVAELNGSAQAKNPVTGEVRDLQVGDVVYAHEVIITADGSQIVLAMGDGNKLAIGESSELGLDAEGIGAARFASLTKDTTESAADNALPDTGSIGTVVALSGHAEARNPMTGETRELHVGDFVYADEIIVTADGSAIAIEFADGSRLDLGRNSEMALNSDVFDMAILATLNLPGTTAQSAQSAQEDMFDALVQESSAELDAIQQALLAGADPSQLEATAAGPGTGGGGEEEGSSFVILDRSGQQTTPDSGFNTNPIGTQFTPPNPEDPPVEEEEAAPVPVSGSGVSFIMNGVEVNESNLKTGSDWNESLLTMPGSFFIVAPDGVATAFTNPTFIVNNAFNFGAADGNVAETTAGSLKFTGYNPNTGEVTYEYTLEQAVDHRSQSSDVFTITVTDSDGDIGVANLVVNIVDDQPVAGNDVITLSGTDDSGTVSNADDTFADQPGSISLQPGAGYALVTTEAGTVAVGQFGSLSYDAAANDGDGAWTYTLNDTGKAEIKALDEGETIEGFDADFNYLLSDFDETNPDAAVVSINVTGINDAPTIDVVPSLSMVSEEGLGGGLPDTLGSPDDTDLATFTGKIEASDPDTLDADNLVFSLHAPTTGIGASFFTWSGGGDTDPLIGSVDGVEKVKIELTDGAGNYLVTLLGPIDHEAADIEDALEFTIGVSVSDGDLSSATSELTIRIEDDSPVAFTADTARLSDQVAGERSVTADLHFKTGADGLGNVVFNLGVEDGLVAATDTSGAPLLLNGEPLYIYGDGTATLQFWTKPGGEAEPQLGMEIAIDAESGNYTLTTFGIVTNGSDVVVGSFSGVGGGNVQTKGIFNQGLGIGDGIDNNLDDMLLTTPNTSVNTNNSEIGIGSGNSFENGELLRMDLVDGLRIDSGTTSGFNFDSRIEVTRFKQEISFSGNGGSATTLVLAALAADETLGEDYLDLGTNNIVIYDRSGAVVYDGANSIDTGVVTVTDLGDSIQVAGVTGAKGGEKTGFSYEILSNTSFYAIEVSAVDQQPTFKLGGFEYTSTGVGLPIDLSYALTGTDADEDSASGTLAATLYPEGQIIPGDTNDDVNDELNGTDGADFIFGYTGNDQIDGGAGADHIMAGDGDDTIIYDAADVVVDGGEGVDTLLVDGALTGAGAIEHIEKLDMSDTDGDSDSIELTADDVLDLSDGELFIDGDTTDSVTLTGFSEVTSDEAGYRLYEGTTSGLDAVKVYVDTTIPDPDAP